MIKIKLGLADSDRIYLERLTDVFGRKYSSKIEIYSCTDISALKDTVARNRINILAVSQDSGITADDVPDTCVLAYLSDSAEIESCNGVKTVFRYQRAELFYRALLDIYSENISDRVVYRKTDSKAHVTLFLPECEGSGAAATAAAFSVLSAEENHKTLFLNLRKFRETESLFSAPGISTLTDVIFSLKSRKSNMRLKLESTVKKAPEGVYFYSSCRSPLDIAELTADELENFMNELGGIYENIVVVSDFCISGQLSVLLELSENIIIVSGNGKMTGSRLQSKIAALKGIESRSIPGLCEKIKLIFNRTGEALNSELPVLGIIPEQQGDDHEIVRKIIGTGVFRRLAETGSTV